MRHSRTESIGKVVDSYLKGAGIDNKIREVRMINSWEDIVGRSVAKVTTAVYFRNGVLFVSLRSSVVRSELMMLREGLIKALNDKAGMTLVTDIVLK